MLNLFEKLFPWRSLDYHRDALPPYPVLDVPRRGIAKCSSKRISTPVLLFLRFFSCSKDNISLLATSKVVGIIPHIRQALAV